MRIAVIHSFYRSSQVSGENNTVLAQVEALREAGHEVELIAQYTDINQGRNPLYAIKTGFDVATGNGYDPTPELTEFSPDIVHVHNLFPNISTRWLKSLTVPIVATFHNFRPLCANGLLFRDETICTDCPDGARWSGVKHSCYRQSRLATLPLAIRNSGGLARNPLVKQAAAFVMLSHRSVKIYVRYGLPRLQAHVLQNFVVSASDQDLTNPRGWIYAGRFDFGKGLSSLIRDWPSDEVLRVYGGPLDTELIQISPRSVNYFDSIDRAELHKKMGASVGLVFPSLLYEQLPTVVLEAFEAGVPVVARAGSAGADLVEEFQAGAVYGPGHMSLREALDYVSSNQEVLRKRARAAYEQNFTKEIWLERIEKLYETVIAEHRNQSR